VFDSAARCTDFPRTGDTLHRAYAKLSALDGMGPFMAGQVIADLKETPVLKRAKDWSDWCAPGPGSMRGLNRIRGNPLDKKWKDAAFINALVELRRDMARLAPIAADLCLQDLQNCLCEFDKMERTLHGEGTPRARYRPNQAG
jgi:alpha-glutamyl/putrescinyl thymine pyrophosphorylase clade 1